jgi:Zn-dependent peptidase ImmA (M78 family)/DNA-binding XRE family transcriptional regulator
MIVGERLRQARNIKGLTQTSLAKVVGVRQPAIAQFESGARQPAPETLEAIAFATGFPTGFFLQERRTHFPLGTLLFRGPRMLESAKTEAHELASLVYEAFESLSRNVKPLPLKVPVLVGEKPAEAARLTRSSLGLSPEGPVRNLVHHLEMAGVAVLAVPKPLPIRDAFSAWTTTEVPVIALSPDRPGDRQRWSAAHELGHLVLHRQIRGEARTLESEADAFAGALLMPKESIRQDMRRPVTLTSLAQLKPKWAVSIAALCMRAHTLGIIDDGQLRYLYAQLSKLGWRKREPEMLDVPVERPRAFKKMAELLYGTPVDCRRLATALSLSPGLVREILDVHAEAREWAGAGAKTKTDPARVLGFKS